MTRLGWMIQTHRRHRQQSLLTTATEIGISAPTLLWIERGRAPNMKTFFLLWRWLLRTEPT